MEDHSSSEGLLASASSLAQTLSDQRCASVESPVGAGQYIELEDIDLRRPRHGNGCHLPGDAHAVMGGGTHRWGTDPRELLGPGEILAANPDWVHEEEPYRIDIPSRSEAEDFVVTFSSDCYALVVVSGRPCFLVFVMAVSAGQLGVLWLVACASPEYLFGEGQWLVPISDSGSVMAMKIIALFVTFFQTSAEFHDAAKIHLVVSSRPRTQMRRVHRVSGGIAAFLQYLSGLAVLFMAQHLVLISQRPLDTVMKVFVVFLTLNFDNHLCRFVIFALGLEGTLDWKVSLRLAGPESWAAKCGQASSRFLFFWIPVCLAVLCSSTALISNVCPITGFRYGFVTNSDPVLMFTPGLGLPAGCCPPQVSWLANASRSVSPPVTVSVPVLSPSAAAGTAPKVYFVVWPDGRDMPSSLQVMEGRGGDGNRGLRFKQVVARPLQMRWWLTDHGFPPTVYDDMRSAGKGGVGLYSNSFPYLAEWTIEDFPWSSRARVHVVAVNPSSGALSPSPVMSQTLLRELCPQHCGKCDHDGKCWQCERGFALDGGGKCKSCAQSCEICSIAGIGRCDLGGCTAGFGLVSGTCLPCSSGSACRSCDVSTTSQQASTILVVTVPPLPCAHCGNGWGLLSNFTCTQCHTPRCTSCRSSDHCEVCEAGFVLSLDKDSNSTSKSECLPCAQHCGLCNLLGAGHCDPEYCEPGYSLTPAGGCAPCSNHCSNCTKSGPGSCDAGGCKKGYGLQGATVCSSCQAKHCDECSSINGRCDACREGFGITPEGTCETCAVSCRKCTDAGKCAECDVGFGLDGDRCNACADQCMRCRDAGPGKCDEGQCSDGWTTVKSGSSEGLICQPCTDPLCQRCDKSGPDFCDEWQPQHRYSV